MKFFTILVLFAGLVASSFTQTIMFEDDFEGSIRPEWQASQGSLSDFHAVSGFAQSGSHSISTLGQIDKTLFVDLGDPQSDTTYSGWFFDNGSTTYEFLLSVAAVHENTTSAHMLSVGVDTRQSTGSYALFTGHSSRSLPLARSVGWHRVDLWANGNETLVYIDSLLQDSVDFANHWQYIYLYANGWEGRPPDSPGYWDNVKAYEGAPVPEPSTLALLGIGTLALVAKRRRSPDSRSIK